MIALFERIDRHVARVEGAVVVFVLIAMVLVASAQALFFNIAQNNVAWAHGVLERLSWADTFLQKGTLWLAFVGASLAAFEDKHISIDVVAKLAPPRIALALRTFGALAAGAISFALAWVFLDACLVADAAVPYDYELLTSDGPAHVCDVSPEQLGASARPVMLCWMRSVLSTVGLSLTSGGGVAQLIAPLGLLMVGLRLCARGVRLGAKLVAGGEVPGSPARSGDAPKELS